MQPSHKVRSPQRLPAEVWYGIGARLKNQVLSLGRGFLCLVAERIHRRLQGGTEAVSDRWSVVCALPIACLALSSARVEGDHGGVGHALGPPHTRL